MNKVIKKNRLFFIVNLLHLLEFSFLYQSHMIAAVFLLDVLLRVLF